MASKLNGQKPIAGYRATAEDIVALYNTPDRHPNALGYELARTTEAVLLALAGPMFRSDYRPNAPEPFTVVPRELCALGDAELARRQGVKARLLAEIS